MYSTYKYSTIFCAGRCFDAFLSSYDCVSVFCGHAGACVDALGIDGSRSTQHGGRSHGVYAEPK